MASSATFPRMGYPIRVITPIVYTLIAGFAFIGNTLNFYSLCVSPDLGRRRSIHVLVWSLIAEGTIWTSVFYVTKMVSYADLGEHFAMNDGVWLNDLWCKSEMYILRVMDFALAYTIVFLCFDRCVQRGYCCYSQRRFLSGICLLICLWLSICYALTPVLFFDQQLKSLNYGAYECIYNKTQVNQLNWLNLAQIQTPYQTLYLVDFVFGNALPVGSMVFLLTVALYKRKNTKSKQYKISGNRSDHIKTGTHPKSHLTVSDDEHPDLIKMVILYVVVYVICQLPHCLYRLVRAYNPSLDSNLDSMNISFAIDLPLIALRLLNRAINPWLSYFLLHPIRNASEQICSSFWCCGCCPCCSSRWSCFTDCLLWFRQEQHRLPSGSKLIREIRPIGNVHRHELVDFTGKHTSQTYNEYVNCPHGPRSQTGDANPELIFWYTDKSLADDEPSHLKSHTQTQFEEMSTAL